MTKEKLRNVLHKKGLARFTAKTIVDPARLAAELEATRRRGWAIDDEERTPGMRCVAAPIFNVFGEALAGISISGPAVRMPLERLGELGPQAAHAAEAITRPLGGPKQEL
jgi:IclR family transcriptional regulator, acetate operon repressor